jgi:hypothetical protein
VWSHHGEARWFVGSVSISFTLSVIGSIAFRDHFYWIQPALATFCFAGTFYQRRKNLGHF